MSNLFNKKETNIKAHKKRGRKMMYEKCDFSLILGGTLFFSMEQEKKNQASKISYVWGKFYSKFKSRVEGNQIIMLNNYI